MTSSGTVYLWSQPSDPRCSASFQLTAFSQNHRIIESMLENSYIIFCVISLTIEISSDNNGILPMFRPTLPDRIRGSYSISCTDLGPQSYMRCQGWHGPDRTYEKAVPIHGGCITYAPDSTTECYLVSVPLSDAVSQRHQSPGLFRGKICPFSVQ